MALLCMSTIESQAAGAAAKIQRRAAPDPFCGHDRIYAARSRNGDRLDSSIRRCFVAWITPRLFSRPSINIWIIPCGWWKRELREAFERAKPSVRELVRKAATP